MGNPRSFHAIKIGSSRNDSGNVNGHQRANVTGSLKLKGQVRTDREV